jgi:hypothetical protein
MLLNIKLHRTNGAPPKKVWWKSEPIPDFQPETSKSRTMLDLCHYNPLTALALRTQSSWSMLLGFLLRKISLNLSRSHINLQSNGLVNAKKLPLTLLVKLMSSAAAWGQLIMSTAPLPRTIIASFGTKNHATSTVQARWLVWLVSIQDTKICWLATEV